MEEGKGQKNDAPARASESDAAAETLGKAVTVGVAEGVGRRMISPGGDMC